MMLEDLRQSFDALSLPAATEAAPPSRDTILHARKLVGEAVASDELLVDCIALEIERLQTAMVQGLAPFFTIPGTGVRFCFGYWAPGSTARPHEHTAWTITAVCRNELEVKTFDRDESYRTKTFVPKNLFKAPAGAVGFIYDPCIHEPVNVSESWSLSLHVVSARDGIDFNDGDALWQASRPTRRLDEVHRSIVLARNRLAYLHLLASILAALDVPAARPTLARCLAVASGETCRQFGARLGPDVSRERPWRLARVSSAIELLDRHEDGMVSLDARTPTGTVEGFAVSDCARDAVSYAARTPLFDVQSLPGALSAVERQALGEALLQTGFFTRVQE
jgi:hypothetical protein